MRLSRRLGTGAVPPAISGDRPGASFIGRRPVKDRISSISVGSDIDMDRPFVPLDPQTRFGAQTPYEANVQVPFRLMSQGLHASNKASEHNVFNAWPVIVVAQPAGQTQNAGKLRVFSHRIILPQSRLKGAA